MSLLMWEMRQIICHINGRKTRLARIEPGCPTLVHDIMPDMTRFLCIVCWLPIMSCSCHAFTLFPAGGFGGYVYNKWGGPELGAGATLTWGFVPPGAMGSAYCSEACVGASRNQIRIWDASQNAFVWTEITALQALVEQALEAWARSANLEFVGPVFDPGLPINDPLALPPGTADLRIAAFDFIGGAQFYGGVGFAPPPNGGTGEGDILLNSANYFQINGSGEGMPYDLFPPGGGPFLNDIQGLLVHELGHSLGLAHPDNLPAGECAVMSIDFACFSITNHQLDRDDLLGVRTLYGFNPDFDRDRQVGCGDLDQLTEAIVASTSDPFWDLNGDGRMSTLDRTSWLNAAGRRNLASGNPYLPGDANLDGAVDGSDFGIWNSNKFTLSSSWCHGDFNTDGVIDGGDFGIWNAHKFTAADEVVPSVPESIEGAWLLFSAMAIKGRIVRHMQRRTLS